MDASCGPSNAITNLSKHAQRDNSLQNEAAARNNQQRNNIANFRSNGNVVDNRLNSEFQQFNNGNDFANNFMTQFKPQVPQVPQQPQQHHHEGNWVNDFSSLSINQQVPIQQHPLQQQQPNMRSDWHQQFLQQDNSQVQFQGSQQNQQQFIPNYANGLAMRNSPMFAQQQHQQVQSQVTEHQELHNLEQQSKHFDNEFDMLEKELQDQHQHQEAEQQQPEIVDDSDKQRFAETARQVQQSMQNATSTQETKSKFENSDFLKLMSSISNRQVELSGDKLVNTTNGEDIRQYLSDPLRDVKNEHQDIDYHEPQHDIPIPVAPIQQQSQPQEQPKQDLRPQVNHLPDPLAHIKDGELGGILDPFSAAKVVSGGQVQMHDWMEDFDDVPATTPLNNRPPRRSILTDKWQEVYDDYRHDDDFH